MRVFLDTEFTNLEAPELLSVAMVSEAGHECYAQVLLESADGQRRVAAASDFTRAHVLSQWTRWSGDPDFGIDASEFGLFAARWLYDLLEHTVSEVELVYSDKVDADLLEDALEHAPRWWSLVKSRVRWTIVSYLNGEEVVNDAMNESWASSLRQQGIGRHHALADARALQAGFEALHGTAEPGKS
jgi:hypothetical protein